MKADTIASALLLFAFSVDTLSAQKASASWNDYLGGPDSSHYSPLKQINVSNVNKIQIAWTYPAGDGASVFCPLVVDNIAYISAKNGALMALDAATGKELWVHSFGTGGGGRAGVSGERGGNYWESKDRKDRRILVTSGGYLYAIDALTGKTVDSFADHGKLDLKTGIDRAPIPLASRTPGRIFENLIILGSFPGEGYLAPPGDIRAFDVRTGKLAWVFHTIPRPGELGYDTWPKDAYKYMGGVDVWGEITVDEKRGIAYFPVSDAKYELYGGDRPGNNLFADSLVALDARTGKYLWHFQTVHHDLWDYDPAAAPQLATVQHDGKMVDIVALATKTGFLYVFDRVTGKPLWPIEERPVPKSEVPGEWTSPTQPFPTMPPAFARQRMTVEDLYTGFMTPEEKTHWTERLAKAQSKGIFTPPGLTDTISIPGVNGGALFWDTGADAANGLVFVESKDFPSILKLVKEGESTAENRGGTIPARIQPGGPGRGGFGTGGPPTELRLGRTVYEGSCQVCHGPDLKGDRAPAIDSAVKRLGADAVRNIIKNGKGAMPAFATMNAEAITDVIEFLDKSEQAPPGSGVPGNTLTERLEPDYPPYVTPPPSRYKTGYGQEGYIIKPPWSTITAYDLNTGEIVWQTPYGDMPEAGPSDKLRGNVTPRSGFEVTAGGLVLFVDNQGKLYALDEKTGRVVYSRDVPNGAAGVPAVYEVNGREYILFSLVGGPGFPTGARMAPGGVSPPAGKKAYVAFALPQ
ncbi:MAG: PQQ-binding-like beta-propeller repeat protein [Acidobacteriia bacterium]|nr:PQQ-binding-like beta-propeller repeat protein [Terriglobia bacterium]